MIPLDDVYFALFSVHKILVLLPPSLLNQAHCNQLIELHSALATSLLVVTGVYVTGGLLWLFLHEHLSCNSILLGWKILCF